MKLKKRGVTTEKERYIEEVLCLMNKEETREALLENDR